MQIRKTQLKFKNFFIEGREPSVDHVFGNFLKLQLLFPFKADLHLMCK